MALGDTNEGLASGVYESEFPLHEQRGLFAGDERQRVRQRVTGMAHEELDVGVLAVRPDPLREVGITPELLGYLVAGKPDDARRDGHAVFHEPPGVLVFRQHTPRDDRGQVDVLETVVARRGHETERAHHDEGDRQEHGTTPTRGFLHGRRRETCNHDDGDERGHDDVILAGEHPERGRQECPDRRGNTWFSYVHHPRRNEQRGSEIVTDSPPIDEFHSAIGPATPNASTTSRSPIPDAPIAYQRRRDRRQHPPAHRGEHDLARDSQRVVRQHLVEQRHRPQAGLAAREVEAEIFGAGDGSRRDEADHDETCGARDNRETAPTAARREPSADRIPRRSRGVRPHLGWRMLGRRGAG